MSRELPLYQGATPQTPQQQMQGPGFTPHVQPMGGMLDAAVQAGLGAGEQYAELKDFGASQQTEHQRRVHDQQMRKEFESRIRLPWGAEGSFYDSEGNRREDEVKAFIIKWQEKNNGIPRPFWLEKNAMRDEGDLMQANDALASRVKLMTLDAEAKNRKQAFQDNYDLAVEQEDWPGAHRVIDRAVEAGQITRARGDIMLLDLRDTALMARARKQSEEDPVAFWNELDDDGSPYAALPFSKRMQLQRLASLSMQGFSRSFVKSVETGNAKAKKIPGSKTSTTSTGNAKKEKEIYNPAPSNITRNLHALWRRYNGDFKEGQGKIDAMPFLAEQGRAMITSPHDETEAEMVIALYKQFGQGEDYAKAMVKQWQEDLARPKGLDPKVTLSHAAQVGYFTREEDAAILALEQEKAQKQEDDEWTPEDEARLKAAKDRRKAAAENAQSLLLANLDIWKNDQQYNGGKERKELTELEIANRLWDTIANYTPGNRDQVQQDSFRHQEAINITAASDNYIRKQAAAQSRNLDLKAELSVTNRLNEEERKAAEKMIADIRRREEEAYRRTQPVDSIVPVSRNKELPSQWGDDGQESILYVPEGWYAEGITVGVTTPNRRYAEAQIVSKPDCTSPTMSKALRRQLGTMNINYDQITVTAAGTKANTAALIFSNEARRDKQGNLSIYRLPAGDGGGTHEIAGINNGGHPAEYAKLETLVKAGKHAEAEQEAKRYIMQYTQPVGNILQTAGVTSSGIDYFLRDMYFNGGEYGAVRVIHRALGVEDSKKFNADTVEAIKNYLKTHTEQQLLERLKNARERLYKSIAANNPEKRQFLSGWLNRNNRVYGQAADMA
ncbi:putative peptidoglycan-binding domain-containing protein [Akkermansia muciniphila]|uniref:putative peptidoglycan-binding domain-containing protein n=1 Tax=Akkermansia muciniphila TaxID=239935 RepID=UPI000FFB82F9|nr:putative peptidoglycan-binding domain-containing protein [Akkermansia muciniphila]